MKSANTNPPGLKKVDRMVNGFLMDLAEMEPNKLDCVALEKSVMDVVRELGRTLMGEVMRRADWLVGMNLSRAYGLSLDAPLSVGRVQTPTLARLVERELQIRDFVPAKYVEVGR